MLIHMDVFTHVEESREPWDKVTNSIFDIFYSHSGMHRTLKEVSLSQTFPSLWICHSPTVAAWIFQIIWWRVVINIKTTLTTTKNLLRTKGSASQTLHVVAANTTHWRKRTVADLKIWRWWRFVMIVMVRMIRRTLMMVENSGDFLKNHHPLCPSVDPPFPKVDEVLARGVSERENDIVRWVQNTGLGKA